MENALLVTALCVSAFYLALVVSNFIGIGRLSRGASQKTPRVSVLVAARDEAENLSRCVDALLRQDYATKAPLEIVVVDDRSRDATGAILADLAAREARVRPLRVDACPAGASPKMHALSVAVAEAEGEILCVTDADCAPPPTWVGELVACFEEDVGFVAGPVLRLAAGGTPGAVADLARMMSITGAAMGAGGAAWGIPWTCAGANLAYRRDALREIGGYAALEQAASGDDALLMQAIALRADWRVGFALSPEACVPSYECNDPARFARRQVRHHARFGAHAPGVRAAFAGVFAYYVWFLVGPLLGLFSGALLAAWAATTAVRFAVEWPTLVRCARRMGTRADAGSLIRAIPVFPAVIVSSALAGLRGRVTWKGQSLRSSPG